MMEIKSIVSAYQDWLWRPHADNASFFYRWGLETLRLITAVVRDIRVGGLPFYAASLVYTTLISLAPLLAICFSVLKGIGVHNQIEPFLKEVLSPLGAKAADVSERMISFVDKIQVGVLGVVGVMVLLYSVISLMRKVENAFNDIWHVRRPRTFAARVRDYLGIVFVGPALLFLSVGITTGLEHAAVIDAWLGVRLFSQAAEGIFTLVPFFLFIVVFTLLYMVMPNTRVRFVPAVSAGVVTALLWKALGFAFGLFVAESASYAAIYSAFATLILFMIWLYVGWMMVLAGAAVSYYLQNPWDMEASHLDPRVVEATDKLATRALLLLVQKFYQDGSGLTLSQIAGGLQMPRLLLEKTIEQMQEAKLITAEGRIDAVYIPRLAAEETTVADVFARLAPPEQKRPFAALDSLFAKAEAAERKVLSTMTLKQIATQEGEKA